MGTTEAGICEGEDIRFILSCFSDQRCLQQESSPFHRVSSENISRNGCCFAQSGYCLKNCCVVLSPAEVFGTRFSEMLMLL
jgi:hypothetical protein